MDGVVALTDAGRIVDECWTDLPNHYLNLKLDEFIVMPNHVHGIIIITDETFGIVGAGFKPAPTPMNSTKRYGLPEIVRGFKTFSSRKINSARGTSGIPVWQRNYYEHVIRDERELENTRQYIVDNPAKWQEDPDSSIFNSLGSIGDM